MVYPNPLSSFDTGLKVAPVRTIRVIEEGKPALWKISQELGFDWDNQDIERVHALYVDDLERNPTDVELFDDAQANSDHSRHRFYKGDLVIDGVSTNETLMDIITEPWCVNPNNSVIAFDDDNSAIQGGEILALTASSPWRPSAMVIAKRLRHITLTAETHTTQLAGVHMTALVPVGEGVSATAKWLAAVE